MSVPRISIVGRPNVGKSSIFNWLAGVRLAIVDDMAGVTRDRMTHVVQHDGKYFEIIDTGGIGINDIDDLDQEIEDQIDAGIREADLLMFVVDARQGVVPLDRSVARRLRAINKPVLLVANKCDGENWELAANDFCQFGLGQPVRVSAKNNRHKSDLLKALADALPELAQSDSGLQAPEMKIAIVGRRNVGKSTFVNAIAESGRMIVSEVPGTTRDSVDVRFELDGKTMVAIDTPGLRRGKSVRTDIDFYGTHRAKRSIRHADVTLMFFAANQRISKVDRQLINYIEQHYKPCIFVVNKWDTMADHMPTSRWADYLTDNFTTLWNVPVAFITALTGKNVKKLLNHAQMLYKQSLEREATSQLNRILRKAIEHHPPPVSGRRRPKIYYATQIGVRPPTIVLKCNDPDAFDNTWRRYLIGVFRDTLAYGEIPIRLILEPRAKDDPADELTDNASGN